MLLKQIHDAERERVVGPTTVSQFLLLCEREQLGKSSALIFTHSTN